MGLLNNLFKPSICDGCKQEILRSVGSVNITQLINQVNNENFLYFSTYGIIVNYIYKNIEIPNHIQKKLLDLITYGKQLMPYEREEIMSALFNLPKLCNNCCNKNFKDFKKNYNNAYIKMNLVKTYPANYLGNFNLDDSINPKIVTYKMEKGKNQTINKIKFMAAFHNCDIVYNITYNYDKNTCTGVYAKRKNNL